MAVMAARVCWCAIHFFVVLVVMLSPPHVAAASQWHARAEGPAAAAISRWRGQWTDEQSREPWKLEASSAAFAPSRLGRKSRQGLLYLR